MRLVRRAFARDPPDDRATTLGRGTGRLDELGEREALEILHRVVVETSPRVPIRSGSGFVVRCHRQRGGWGGAASRRAKYYIGAIVRFPHRNIERANLFDELGYGRGLDVKETALTRLEKTLARMVFRANLQDERVGMTASRSRGTIQVWTRFWRAIVSWPYKSLPLRSSRRHWR